MRDYTRELRFENSGTAFILGVRADGEIGRRTALRTRRRKAWEFKSPSAHIIFTRVSLNLSEKTLLNV